MTSTARPPLTAPVAALAVTVAGVLAALVGQAALVVPVLGAQVLLVVGWYSILGIPARDFGAALAIGCGLIGDVAMVVRGDDPSLGPLAGVLGPAVGIAFALQLARRDGRARLTTSVAVTLSAVSLSVLGAALVAERGAVHGREVTIAALIAAGIATAVTALPEAAELLAVPVAVAVAVAVVAPVAGIEAWHILAIALAAGVLAWSGRWAAGFAAHDLSPGGRTGGAESAGSRTARRAAAREARRAEEAILVVGSALPIVLAAPASYLLGRLLVG